MKLFVLAIIQSILLVGGQVWLKLALNRMSPFEWSWKFFGEVLTNVQFALCGIFFVLGSLLWIYIVKHFPFSLAYPMVSLSYVFGMIASIVIFHENVDTVKWLGVLLIMAGCFLISR